jgi:hypothetical protein
MSERGGEPIMQRSKWAWLWQTLGALISVGLIVWCVRTALGNPATIERLGELRSASPLMVAALLGLSALTICETAFVLWVLVKPIKRLPYVDVLAINALCTLLGNLPFKISLLTRFVVHSRRDGMAIASIVAWLGAFAVVLLITLGPPVGASLLVGSAEFVWWVITLGLMIGLALVTWAMSKVLASDWGWQKFLELCDRTMIDALSRFVRSALVERLHASVRILSDWRALVVCLLARVVGIALQAVRFALAAHLMHIELSIGQVVIAGATYFLIQGAAPAGALGAREAGVGAMLIAVTRLPIDQAAAVILTVSAAETIVNIVMGLGGAAWLRVDRLLGPGAKRSPESA